MGAADIVPGVSGGTMAFILGIYEELVDSIRRFGSKELWSPLLRRDIKTVIKRSNWQFLSSVAFGILLAVILLSHFLEKLLTEHPVAIWSFFFGLVLASALIVSKRVSAWGPEKIISLIVGALIAYIIVGLVPVNTPDAPWFLVLSGSIAICAMILPGISGSFLLVILGKYEIILSAVNTKDIATLMYVGIGAVGGLLIFSHFLSWLLHKYHDVTIACLTGLMIGSLQKVWPWKESADSIKNIIPQLGPDAWLGISLMIAGAIVVLALDKLSNR